MMSDQPIKHLDSNMMLADDALLTKAADWHSAGQRLALAFVIHTWGSSPRQVGSLMLVREDSQIAGSVSGGCVEGAVIDAALEIIKTERLSICALDICSQYVPSTLDFHFVTKSHGNSRYDFTL